MKHARPDYDRIQDPLGKIPDDEPVFLIRGQDLAGPDTLRFWANRAESLGASREICALVRTHAKDMASWQLYHASKVPDLPKGTP